MKFRFRLRTMFIATALVAGLCAWLGRPWTIYGTRGGGDRAIDTLPREEDVLVKPRPLLPMPRKGVAFYPAFGVHRIAFLYDPRATIEVDQRRAFYPEPIIVEGIYDRRRITFSGVELIEITVYRDG